MQEVMTLRAGRNVASRRSHPLMEQLGKLRPEAGGCRTRMELGFWRSKETDSVVPRRVGARQAGVNSHLFHVLTL